MSLFDNFGVEYSSPSHLILVKTPGDLVSYPVPSSCFRITGGKSSELSSFRPCSNSLKSITFCESSAINTIDAFVFANMAVLQTVDFSNCRQLLTLSNSLFDSCPQLTNVILPPNLEKFNAFVFTKCGKLLDLVLPDSVKTIGYWFLNGCKSCKHLEISMNSNLVNIEAESLLQSSLTSFFIPRNVTKLFGSAFIMSSIKEFSIHPENKNFVINSSSIFSADLTTLIYAGASGNYIVPSTVKVLGDGCMRGSGVNYVTFAGRMDSFGTWFLGQSQIKSFTYPPGITVIKDCSFFGSSALTSVTLTNEIKTISSQAFRLCSALKTIDLMQVSSIGSNAFCQCVDLEKVILPPTLTILGTAAFAMCPKLIIDASQNNNFLVENEMLFTNNHSLLSEFFGTNTIIVIPVFCSKIGTAVFSQKKIIQVVFNTTLSFEIQDKAFSYSSIESITFPSELRTIGNECFMGCPNLTYVEFKGNSFTSIPEKAFYNCHKLKQIKLPSSLKSIGISAFYLCKSLASINIESTELTLIADYSFASSGLLAITFPETLSQIQMHSFKNACLQYVCFNQSAITNIPLHCFFGCNQLTQIIFGDLVENIDSYSFSECKSLKEIILPHSIVTIRSKAFFNCPQLTNVTLPIDCHLAYVYGQAFSECPNLHSITVDPNDRFFTFEEGVLMNKNKSTIIFFLPTSSLNIFVVPSGVQIIGQYAFQDCTNLKTIVIPDGKIEEIGYGAFSGCTKLSFVYLPKSIRSVSKNAFQSCNSLKCGSVIYPDSIRTNLIESGIPENVLSQDCPSLANSRCNANINICSKLIRSQIFVFWTFFIN